MECIILFTGNKEETSTSGYILSAERTSRALRADGLNGISAILDFAADCPKCNLRTVSNVRLDAKREFNCPGCGEIVHFGIIHTLEESLSLTIADTERK